MKWQNTLTNLLKIDYPVVQAPMLGITTPAMVAAISNAGGLGSLPVGGLSPDATLALIKEVKILTDRPFAVNLFAHNNPIDVDKEQFTTMQGMLATFCAANSIVFVPPVLETLQFNSYKTQLDALLEERVPVVSFTFGIPDDETIMALKNTGARLIGTATCVEEALLLESKYIDIVTAQGFEAGGHRGSFIKEQHPPLIGTMALIPQVVDAIHIPVLAAGGIADGRGIVAAFVLGSKGVQLGTAFIASHESAAGNAHKHIIQNASATDTVLTRAFSGRWARGIENKFMKAVEGSGVEIPAYPVQVSLTTSIRTMAQQLEQIDYFPMWAGQFSSKAVRKSSTEIFQALVEQAEQVYNKRIVAGQS